MKKVIFIIGFVFLLFGCKSKLKTRELGAYTYKTAVVSTINSKLVVTAFGQGKTKEACIQNAMVTALKDVIFKGLQDGNPSMKQAPILGKPSDAATYNDFFNSFTAPSGKYANYIELYNQPISQNRSKKVRKLDRVVNMTLEFQFLVDRNGLVNLFKQADISKTE